MYQNDKILYLLKTFNLLGISIYIDDFGTGYSNFAQLLSMEIKGIKIDKGLINLLNVKGNSGNHIVKSIVDICDATGFTITAEGIERPDQYELVKEWNCHFSQGYLLSKPMPYKVFVECISELHVIKAI